MNIYASFNMNTSHCMNICFDISISFSMNKFHSMNISATLWTHSTIWTCMVYCEHNFRKQGLDKFKHVKLMEYKILKNICFNDNIFPWGNTKWWHYSWKWYSKIALWKIKWQDCMRHVQWSDIYMQQEKLYLFMNM